jgi:hypothetical protein
MYTPQALNFDSDVRTPICTMTTAIGPVFTTNLRLGWKSWRGRLTSPGASSIFEGRIMDVLGSRLMDACSEQLFLGTCVECSTPKSPKAPS